MLAKQLFEEVSNKIGEIIQDSPMKDVEKNAKTALSAAFSKMDLITREEFEVQQQMIEHLCGEIAMLHEEIEQLKQSKNG
ncbi:MAG: accessory factor UbiK family protein [Neisseriaceae bacterium]|nr:accessory factor UbiK family protein [Neisseriaceae bacterium]